MAQNNYFLNVPIPQWELYMEYITRRIYGISNGQYTIIRIIGSFTRIEFSTNMQIPLINSLPRTLFLDNQIVYFEDKDKLQRISNSMRTTVADYLTPGGIYHSEASPILLSNEDLPLVIKELARNKEITSFAKLTEGKYLIYMELYPITIILRVINEVLRITIYDNVINETFDVDDGYSGILKCMNSSWSQWKKTGDITAPIHPPNYV